MRAQTSKRSAISFEQREVKASRFKTLPGNEPEMVNEGKKRSKWRRYLAATNDSLE